MTTTSDPASSGGAPRSRSLMIIRSFLHKTSTGMPMAGEGTNRFSIPVRRSK
jgi:hypothetical protein